MISRKIKNYKLDLEKTLPYFLEHIGCGKKLSEIIIQKIDFTKGSFYTILPCNTELKRMLDFTSGGIIPSVPCGKKSYRIKGFSEKFHPKKIVTMDQECTEFITSFLKKSNQNWAVVENYMLEPESRFVSIENVKMVPFNSDVYYFLNKKNSKKEIYESIRKSSQVWHFLTVLTHLKDPIPAILTEGFINQICVGVEYVIAGAYDGEGYIFWEKSINI